MVRSSVMVLTMTIAGQSGIDGEWIMTIDTPRGAMDSKLMISTEGEAVSGTMTSPVDGADVPIKGTLKGSTLTFSVTVEAPPGPITLTMTGEVAENTIKGSFSGGPASGAFSAKRP